MTIDKVNTGLSPTTEEEEKKLAPVRYLNEIPEFLNFYDVVNFEQIPRPDLVSFETNLNNDKQKPVHFYNLVDVDTDLEEQQNEFEVWTSTNVGTNVHPGLEKALSQAPKKKKNNLNTSRADRKIILSQLKTGKNIEALMDDPMGFVNPYYLPCPLELAKDAKLILSAELNTSTASRKVVFCVLLRNKHGFFKKFAFHNGETHMSIPMRQRALKLGYDVIQAEQSHAEGEFLQFLLTRHAVRPGFYSHIIGMGCSKKHCSECNALMNFLLASNYTKLTASVNADGSGKLNTIKKKIDNFTHSNIYREGKSLKCRYQQSVETSFELIQEIGAVGESPYDNYYLPNKLKNLINNCLAFVKGNKISLRDNRFTKDSHETNVIQEGADKGIKRPRKTGVTNTKESVQ